MCNPKLGIRRSYEVYEMEPVISAKNIRIPNLLFSNEDFAGMRKCIKKLKKDKIPDCSSWKDIKKYFTKLELYNIA